MKVFKFGGASVKDAESVKNIGTILSKYKDEHLVIVVSAMGKSTNALEQIVKLDVHNEMLQSEISLFFQFHATIISELELTLSLTVFEKLLQSFIDQKEKFVYAQFYDQIVSIGELLSSTIFSSYLTKQNIPNQFLDARTFIITDLTWKEGQVLWDETKDRIQELIIPVLQSAHVVTQGFIGGTKEGFTTTLGREGSDYTAAVISNCINAEGLYIWKDVLGVFNADPKMISSAEKIEEMTYYEAIEMTYYGATVIHPKTIKPLQNKHIPLYVKSFLFPDAKGTLIYEDKSEKKYPPIIVFKKNQILFSVFTLDFSFMVEENISKIFSILSKYHIKANLLQTSALSFSFVMDLELYKLENLKTDLNGEFKVSENLDLTLLTIRHFTTEIINDLCAGKDIILTQKSRNTMQVLYKQV